MKKGAGVVICAILLVSIFSASFASASWFTSFWHDLFFGKPQPLFSPEEACFDSDEGFDYSKRGTASFGGESRTDTCIKGGGAVSECSGPECYLNEYYCASNFEIGQKSDISCTYGCKEGVCAGRSSCVNKCGDGICEEVVCLSLGCPCAETMTNCPRDCAARNVTGIAGVISERVTCTFANSSVVQKCYSSDSRFGCSGSGSCSVSVSGTKGQKLTWKGSCGGTVSTTTDGADEYARFDCSFSGPVISEQVKCFFSAYASSTTPRCYAIDKRFGCTAYAGSSCIMNVTGARGQTLTWRSTCSAESYVTAIDGSTHYVAFRCATPFMSPQ